MIRGLIRNHIDDRPSVRRRLVGALIPGAERPGPRRQEQRVATSTTFPACRRPGQFGCVVAWSAYNETPPPDSRFGRSPTTPDTSDDGPAERPGVRGRLHRPGAADRRHRAPDLADPDRARIPGSSALLILQTYGGRAAHRGDALGSARASATRAAAPRARARTSSTCSRSATPGGSTRPPTTPGACTSSTSTSPSASSSRSSPPSGRATWPPARAELSPDSGSTTSVSPSTAAIRVVSPGSAAVCTPRAPDLAVDPDQALGRAALDHRGPLADQPLGPGRDAIAAQEADPEVHLRDLDQRRDRQQDQAPGLGQHEHADDREREQHRQMMMPRSGDVAAASADRRSRLGCGRLARRGLDPRSRGLSMRVSYGACTALGSSPIGVCSSLPLRAAAEPPAPPLPDAVMSDNVEYLGSIKQDVGMTTGARMRRRPHVRHLGARTSRSTTSPTRRRRRPSVSSSRTSPGRTRRCRPTAGARLRERLLLRRARVRGGARPDGLRAVLRRPRPGEHQAGRDDPDRQPHRGVRARLPVLLRLVAGRSSTREGSSTARRPTVIGNWIDALAAQGVDEESCHHIREIRPGVLLTACQPFAVISINAKDGGSPAHAEGALHRRGGQVRPLRPLAARGQGQVRADRRRAELQGPLRAQRQRVLRLQRQAACSAASRRTFEGPVAQVPPAGNGFYADGKPVAGALGCSVHWFQEHPTLPQRRPRRDLRVRGRGALPADRRGRLDHRAGLLPLARQLVLVAEVGRARTTSSTRSTTCAASTSCSGRASTTSRPRRSTAAVPGTKGVTAAQAPTKAQLASRKRLANKLESQGWSPFICQIAVQHR